MQTMQVVARLQQDMSFFVEAGSGHQVTLDMLDDQGERVEGKLGLGFSPMEMLLVALAGCTGISVLSILRKRRLEITGYELRVQGQRATSHPKVFTEIAVEHIFTGHNIAPEFVERAIELSETRYCGVEAMLSKTARITHTYHLS